MVAGGLIKSVATNPLMFRLYSIMFVFADMRWGSRDTAKP